MGVTTGERMGLTQAEIERAHRMMERWATTQGDEATSEQRDRVGRSYMVEVLGVGEVVADAFIRGDALAYDEVGRKQAGIAEKDTSKFWTEMKEIFPEWFSDEDIEFLAKRGGVVAATTFLNTLHLVWGDPGQISGVLRELAVNAHVYK